MIHFHTIINALFFGMSSSPCSDITETTTSENDLDTSSISTASQDGRLTENEIEIKRTLDHRNQYLRIHPTQKHARSLPINCPSPSLHHIREMEFKEDMTAIYDAATWRMYHRIVDSRKMQQQSKKRRGAHRLQTHGYMDKKNHHGFPKIPQVVFAVSAKQTDFDIFYMDD